MLENIPEPSNGTRVVVDNGAAVGEPLKLWWRDDVTAAGRTDHPDERWFDDNDGDPMAWTEVLRYAEQVFLVERKPYGTAHPLPTWDEMSDLDKGAALLHDRKRESEGDEYAVENYPCRYLEDPLLTALDDEDASEHAAEVCGEDVFDRIGADEYHRLYELALNHKPV